MTRNGQERDRDGGQEFRIQNLEFGMNVTREFHEFRIPNS
jgi:hypothetical protein